MKVCLVLASVLVIVIASPTADKRTKRSLFQLGDMLECTTNKGLIQSTIDYNRYGCWCGFGGEGIPLDATDQCCQDHDFCYENTREEAGCGTIDVYTIRYKYEAHLCGGRFAFIRCKRTFQYDDDDDKAACKRAICRCDAVLAECLANHQDSYNDEFYNFPQSQCEDTPRIADSNGEKTKTDYRSPRIPKIDFIFTRDF
ncbi:basic phospholipase A2 RVV-VD-like [Glandiceps talaboti]